MASKFTYDTNILRIREVFAINPQKQDFIQPYQIPMIYTEGRLKWWSTVEFLSSISVPSASTSVLNLLEAIQPGLSSLSTAVYSTLAYALPSTVTGLGTAGYVSTSYLQNAINQLSLVNQYISATTLYDVIANLGNLAIIGGQVNPMGMIGSNFTSGYGYVSTSHITKYGLLESSIGWTGSNARFTTLGNDSEVNSVVVPIHWYSTQIVSSTQFTVDVFANLLVTPSNVLDGIHSTIHLSSFFTRTGYNTPLGEHVTIEIPYGVSSYTIGSLRFPFSQTTLRQDSNPNGYPTSLQLKFAQSNEAGQDIAITTAIPTKSGVFVTLNNLM
jgi:hypothetical protein